MAFFVYNISVCVCLGEGEKVGQVGCLSAFDC